MHGVRQLGSARTFYEECLDGAEALQAKGYNLDSGRLLAVYPFGHRNPFLRMLYASAFDHGFAVLPLKNLAQLDEVPPGLDVVVHHHWVHRIFDKLTSVSEAEKAVEAFLATVEKQKRAGRPLVWTVHNVLSHRTPFPEQEVQLRASFAALVDHIHIMNPKTPALCAPYYGLEESKLFRVPHPAYAGVYGDYVSREQARITLGLQPADCVFLLFGELGPYKGTRHFLEQLDALQDRMTGKARIIIAGKEGDGAFMEDIFRLTSGRADVQLYLGHVDDQNVQTFFRAADVAVCAHTAGLNSGVVATALTFGCPTVMASRMAHTVEGAEEFIFPFDATDMSTAVDACVAAYELSRQPGLKPAMKGWAQKMAPGAISNRFFDALRGQL